MGSDSADRIWQRAVRLLAAHDRSEHEIRARLAGEGASSSMINATVRRLRRLHYLDDGRFAREAADAAQRRGHGSERVRAALAAKGVADSLIEAVITTTFADEAELARRALARRSVAPPQGPAARAKAARYLLRQGFPESVVLSILGEDYE